MSRVPSATSGNLNKFVRRARENAFELNIVGATRLQNQIQSMFGGVSVKNLPPAMQQIIAEDRALGGGGGSGPLTLTNPFTNEELSPDEQKAAANQMATQQGASPPFPEVQQPQEDNSVVESARQASTNMQQLVDDGTLTEQSRQSIVRSVALGDTLDVDLRNEAIADVKALSDQFRSEQVDINQTQETIKFLATKYGRSVLNAIPEWQELTGTKEKFQADVAEAIKAKAASHGLPLEAFRFDQRSSAIVKDDEWFEIDAYKTKKNTEAQKPILESNRVMSKMANERYTSTLSVIEKQYTINRGVDEDRASAWYVRSRKEALDVLNGELSGLLGNVAASSQPAAQSQTLQPAAIPGLPAGVSLVGQYANAQEGIAANPPNGSYFMLGGALARRRADGVYEMVQ